MDDGEGLQRAKGMALRMLADRSWRVQARTQPSSRLRLDLLSVLAVGWITAVLGTACATSGTHEKKEIVRIAPMKMVVVNNADGTQSVESLDPSDLFREAGQAFEEADHKAAARKYILIIERFPKSKYAGVARFNAGLALEKQRKFDEAYPYFEALAAQTKGSKDAQDSLFHMSTCRDARNDHKAVVAIMNRILAPEFEDISPIHRLEALARRGKARHELRQLALAERDFKAALKVFKRHIANNTLRRSYFVSLAQFRIGEIYRELFGTIRFRLPLERMARDLEDKSNFFLKTQAAYLRTLRFSHPDLAVAAGFRLGAIYEKFYDDMMGAEVPAELTREEVDIYYEALKKKIRPLITKAIDIYERNIRMAQRLGRSKADWVRKSRASLARLKEVLRHESSLSAERQLKKKPLR